MGNIIKALWKTITDPKEGVKEITGMQGDFTAENALKAYESGTFMQGVTDVLEAGETMKKVIGVGLALTGLGLANEFMPKNNFQPGAPPQDTQPKNIPQTYTPGPPPQDTGLDFDLQDNSTLIIGGTVVVAIVLIVIIASK